MKIGKDLSVFRIIVILGELLLLNIGYYCSFSLYKSNLSYQYFIEERNFLLFFNLAYFFSISVSGMILDRRNVKIEDILDKVFKLILTQFLILSAIIALTGQFKEFNLKFITTLFVLEFWISVTWRLTMRATIKKIREKKENQRTIIILGTGKIASLVYNQIVINSHNSYKLLGFFNERQEGQLEINNERFQIIGSMKDVIPFLEKNKVDEIFCTLSAGEDRKAIPILNYSENNLVKFYFVPDFKRFLSKKVNLQFFDDIPIVSLRTEPLEYLPNRMIKRSFDLLFSGIFLITIFPIFLALVGIAIKLSSKGPIFFKQRRTGKNGKEFTCIKFRSMNPSIDADEKQAVKNDLRVTKIGAFLRKTNLDETPQFLNVFAGDMSIVGPRPHMLKHTNEYSTLIDKYMLRHLAKPGITGFAQVSGCRGETRDIREMEKRIIRDVWYLEHWTFWLDLKIIFQTAILMITGDDKAY
jgi:putative colanic acid biosysnthesis UDP-glucose lipid carrier transferase